jgi:hypothetical protein
LKEEKEKGKILLKSSILIPKENGESENKKKEKFVR